MRHVRDECLRIRHAFGAPTSRNAMSGRWFASPAGRDESAGAPLDNAKAWDREVHRVV